jgi:[ribosomal protein S5]-alanine N-acetyltransferase
MGRIQGWPAILTEPDLLELPLTLQPLRFSDAPVWRQMRAANAAWLSPWVPATNPEAFPVQSRIRRYTGLARQTPVWPYLSISRDLWETRRGVAFRWGVRYGGQLAGQVSAWHVTWGPTRSADVAYWIDEKFAGRGIAPTAVAMAVDHCILVMGLHRLVASIRPENAASRRVVEKLGFRNEGLHVGEVHIDGAWRDHLCYAITAEEAPAGLLPRWRYSLAAARSDRVGDPT